jgi:hypothetical protein
VLQYVITDFAGRSVITGDVAAYSGFFKKTISMEQFPAGTYTVTFIKEHGTDMQFFMLIK